MIALIILAALAATAGVPLAVLCVTGGRALVHTEHGLPEPAHYPRRTTKTKKTG